MRPVTLFVSLAVLTAAIVIAQDAPKKFRTDADGPFHPLQIPKLDAKGKKKAPKPGEPEPLEWFALVDGEFPPAGSAHAIPGELMLVDHLERRFQIRVDRADNQDRGVWDLPLDATMLPYGTIWYHGAPAALQDIPLGTHLHGQFYLRDPNDPDPLPEGPYKRLTPEAEFRRCFRLEDDFTHHSRQNQIWKIDSVDLEAKKLTATLMENGKPKGDPKLFDLLSSTRVFEGKGFAALANLKAGQTAQFNFTWVTLYGPGRITDIWLDDTSRQLATAQQMESHRNHTRERGLAGIVRAVDDEKQTVTIEFFGGVDPKLFDDLTKTNPEPVGWPLSKEAADPASPKGTIAVARESLMTHDPVNDRKGGNILKIEKIPPGTAGAGVQITVQCDMMLEGFRPKRIVRFYPATWKVVALPREEQFHGRE